MAVDSYDPTTGRPIFSDSGAPDIAVDPTAVGIFAAEVGNRIIKADLAGLDAYTYKRKGLGGYALDTGFEYVHDGAGWTRKQQAFGFAAGQVTTAASGVTAVTFPAGRFTTAPLVFLSSSHANPTVPYLSGSATSTGFNVSLYTVAGAQVVGTVRWFAVQMTAVAAAG